MSLPTPAEAAVATRPAIDVRGLVKEFSGRRTWQDGLQFWRRRSPVRVLHGVDLAVQAGELVALLGPNGAGKTTLLKIISTLVRPTAGDVHIMGRSVRTSPRAARRHVGYVLADERSFYWRLSCRDNLRFFAALYGIYGNAAERRIIEVAALVGLTEHLEQEFTKLSTGQRQRMAIARGLLSDPPVLLFDEATRSLDPGRALRLRKIIRNILIERARKAVLFATHDMEEARQLADRVVLMQHGRVMCEGTYRQVEERVLEVFREETRAEELEFARVFPELLVTGE